MAKFIVINGARIQVPDATNESVINRYTVNGSKSLGQVQIAPVTTFSSTDLTGGVPAKTIFGNSSAAKIIHGFSLTNGSGGTLNSDSYQIVGNTTGLLASAAFSGSMSLAANATESIELNIPLEVPANETLYVSGTDSGFTGTITLDLRYKA